MWVLWRGIPVRWVIDFDDPSHSSAVTSSRTWIEPPWLTRPTDRVQTVIDFPPLHLTFGPKLVQGVRKSNIRTCVALLHPACLKFESFKQTHDQTASSPSLSRSWHFSMPILSVAAASYARNVQRSISVGRSWSGRIRAVVAAPAVLQSLHRDI